MSKTPEEFAQCLMAENQVFLKACLKDLAESHTKPSERTLELVDDLKGKLNRLERQQEKSEEEFKSIMEKHSEKHSQSMRDILKSLTSIDKKLVNVYTKEQIDEKLEGNNSKYASKRTENWLDRIGWEIIKTILLAGLGLIIYTKI